MRKEIAGGMRGTSAPLEQRIIELLRQPGYTPLNPGELAPRLGLAKAAHRNLEQTLAQLERAGRIARLKQGNRFGLPLEADLVPGRIRMNRQGVGTLQPTDPQLGAIRIPNDASATA